MAFLPTTMPKGSRGELKSSEVIISLYAGGITVRNIQPHMRLPSSSGHPICTDLVSLGEGNRKVSRESCTAKLVTERTCGDPCGHLEIGRA